MIKRTGWKAAVPAEGLVTVPFLFREGVLAPKGDCPVPAEDSRVVNRLAAGSFPFREDASKGRKRSGRGIYPLWLEFSFRGRCPKYLLAVRFLKA